MPELALETRAVAETKIAQTWVELTARGASALSEARPRPRGPAGGRLGAAVSLAAHASLIAILLYARPPIAAVGDAAAIPIEIVIASPSQDAATPTKAERLSPSADTPAQEAPAPALPPSVDRDSPPLQQLGPTAQSPPVDPLPQSPPAQAENVEEAPQLSTWRDSPPIAEKAPPAQFEQADVRPVLLETSTAISPAPPSAQTETPQLSPAAPQPQSTDAPRPSAEDSAPQQIEETTNAAALAEERPPIPVEQSPRERPLTTSEAEKAAPPPAPQRAAEQASSSSSVLPRPTSLQSSASLTSPAIETSPPRTPPAMPTQPSARTRPKAPSPRVVAHAEVQDRQISRTANAEGQAAAPAPARAGESAGEIDAYKSELVARINAAKHYPDDARTRGARGVAVVAFSINGSGGLGAASIQRTSGDSALDVDAVATVRRAAPFPSPPLGAPRAYSVPLNYRLP